MKRSVGLFIVLTILSCSTKKDGYASSASFRLAAPQLNADSVLFKNSSEVSLQFAFPGSQIRYSLNEGDVTKNSDIYTGSFKLFRSTFIKAKAFHPDFKPSDQTELQLLHIKNDIHDATISIKPAPYSNYAGNGSNALVDMQKGTIQFRDGKKWLGFQSGTVGIDLKFNKEKAFSKVVLSTLLDQNAWIFLPKRVTVFSGNHEIGSVDIEKADEKQSTKLKFIEIPVKPDSYPGIRLVVYSLDKIPEWHQGKGTQAWLFIDELLIH